MIYTYLNVWLDGQPWLAYEVPEDRSMYWIPPMIVRPKTDGRAAYPNERYSERTWTRMYDCLSKFQADPRYTLNESLTAWDAEHGWPLPQVRP